jgi:hypothetical protein
LEFVPTNLRNPTHESETATLRMYAPSDFSMIHGAGSPSERIRCAEQPVIKRSRAVELPVCIVVDISNQRSIYHQDGRLDGYARTAILVIHGRANRLAMLNPIALGIMKFWIDIG